MAVGLGSMDMPVPAISEWEWLNWKFPRAVRAGDTIYARWTLTQKRAPVGGSSTAIVVWRVDVHTAAGALCAEGEVGASVLRAPQARTAEPAILAAAAEPAAAAGAGATTPRRGRRRRRTTGSDPAKPKAGVAVEAPVQAPAIPPAATGSERTASGRRRRRRRPATSAATRNGDSPVPAAPSEAPAPAAAVPVTTVTGTTNPLTRAIRRLRRP